MFFDFLKKSYRFETKPDFHQDIDVELDGERLVQEEKKIAEIVERTIEDMKLSGCFKPEALNAIAEQIRKNTKVGYGYKDPFNDSDCLTLDEKKALGLYTRRQYSRELINSLTEKGLAVENPNAILNNIFQQNYHKVSRKYELEQYKAEGYKFVEISDCGDERDCKAVKRLKKIWAIDEVPELPLPNCKAEYCRCSYIIPEQEFFRE